MILKLTFKLHSWNSSLMKAFTRSDASFRKSYWAGFENQMHSMLCKYTENFFFNFFYDLSLLQKFTYYSANDKKVLSESASFKNVPGLWAQNLEVTLLVFGNPFHTGAPEDNDSKDGFLCNIVSDSMFDVTTGNIVGLLYPETGVPFTPFQFFSPELLS